MIEVTILRATEVEGVRYARGQVARVTPAQAADLLRQRAAKLVHLADLAVVLNPPGHPGRIVGRLTLTRGGSSRMRP